MFKEIIKNEKYDYLMSNKYLPYSVYNDLVRDGYNNEAFIALQKIDPSSVDIKKHTFLLQKEYYKIPDYDKHLIEYYFSMSGREEFDRGSRITQLDILISRFFCFNSEGHYYFNVHRVNSHGNIVSEKHFSCSSEAMALYQLKKLVKGKIIELSPRFTIPKAEISLKRIIKNKYGSRFDV